MPCEVVDEVHERDPCQLRVEYTKKEIPKIWSPQIWGLEAILNSTKAFDISCACQQDPSAVRIFPAFDFTVISRRL